MNPTVFKKSGYETEIHRLMKFDCSVFKYPMNCFTVSPLGGVGAKDEVGPLRGRGSYR